MAKNLKLNIKNAQLAEALKLSQPKKPAAKKKAAEAAPVEAPAVPPAEETLQATPPAVEIETRELEIKAAAAQKKKPFPKFLRKKLLPPHPSLRPLRLLLRNRHRLPDLRKENSSLLDPPAGTSNTKGLPIHDTHLLADMRPLKALAMLLLLLAGD